LIFASPVAATSTGGKTEKSIGCQNSIPDFDSHKTKKVLREKFSCPSRPYPEYLSKSEELSRQFIAPVLFVLQFSSKPLLSFTSTIFTPGIFTSNLSPSAMDLGYFAVILRGSVSIEIFISFPFGAVAVKIILPIPGSISYFTFSPFIKKFLIFDGGKLHFIL